MAGTTRDATQRKPTEQTAVEHTDGLAPTDLARDDILVTLSHALRHPQAPLRNARVEPAAIMRNAVETNETEAQAASHALHAALPEQR